MLIKQITPPEEFIFSLYIACSSLRDTKEIMQKIDDLDIPVVVYHPHKEGGGEEVTLMDHRVWSHDAMRAADAVLFWFPGDDLCPITLFQLGGQLELRCGESLFIGCDEGFFRKNDLEILLDLKGSHGPELFFSLEETVTNMYLTIRGGVDFIEE